MQIENSQEYAISSAHWRQINLQYFFVESNINVPTIGKFHKNIRNQSSLDHQKPQQKTQVENDKSNPSNLINNNPEGVKQINEIQEIIDEIIDQVCQNIKISESINDINQKENVNGIKDEQLHQQINEEINVQKSDDLGAAMKEIENELEQLRPICMQQLKLQQSFVEEINKHKLYTYSIEKTGEFQLRISRNFNNYHEDEVIYIREMIKLIQDYQIAESIGKATFNDKNNTITVILDKYINPTPLDMKIDQFERFQRLREEPLEIPMQPSGLRSDDIVEMQMCHFCRQMTDIKNLKQCSYNHIQMSLHEYNEDLLTGQRYTIRPQDQFKYFHDLYSSNYIIEDGAIQCKRYFCTKCLRYEFDNFETTSLPWICPLCKGLCSCIRCLRNDSIYKLKRTYLELRGDLQDLYEISYFELLVSNKRTLIKALPLSFIKESKQFVQNIETKQKNKGKTKRLTKNIKGNQKKKKIDQTIKNRIHKLSHIESSSSSSQIKRQKMNINNINNSDSNVNNEEAIFVQ